jgi:hypothetical protein
MGGGDGLCRDNEATRRTGGKSSVIDMMMCVRVNFDYRPEFEDMFVVDVMMEEWGCCVLWFGPEIY